MVRAPATVFVRDLPKKRHHSDRHGDESDLQPAGIAGEENRSCGISRASKHMNLVRRRVGFATSRRRLRGCVQSFAVFEAILSRRSGLAKPADVRRADVQRATRRRDPLCLPETRAIHLATAPPSVLRITSRHHEYRLIQSAPSSLVCSSSSSSSTSSTVSAYASARAYMHAPPSPVALLRVARTAPEASLPPCLDAGACTFHKQIRPCMNK